VTRLVASTPPPEEVVLAPVGGSVVMALVIGVLFTVGVYLLMQRALTRVLIGLSVITHGANLLLLVAGGRAGPAAFVAKDGSLPEGVVDPLPQAMALTAIVISFAVSALLLALAYRSYVLTRDDAVQDDVEDRRIARVGEGR
jgi:multicomponent Na+:H+ antiporter subunit C